LKNFLKFLKPYRWWVLLTVIFIALQSLSDLYLPDLNASIIDEGVMMGNVGTILRYGAVMLLVALLVGVCTLGTTYFSTKAALAYGRDMRSALFRKVQAFSQSDLDHFGTPSLITRTTNDVNQLQQTMQMLLRTIITTPILLIGGIIMCLKQDVKLSVILLFIVPIIAVVVGITTTRAHPWFKKQQTQVDTLNQVLREKLSGIRVIRAFVRTDYEEEHYDRENQEMLRIAVHAAKLMTVLMPLVNLVMNAATLAAYYMGALRIDTFGMEIGSLTAFVTYLMQILMSVMASSMMMNMIPRAMTSVGRINEVLDYTPSIQDTQEALSHPDVGSFTGLEFRDVSFHYPEADRPVLEHVSFVTRPGETTAIIGSTGSGKSTLVNLIPRIYDATSGEILLNGVDIRNLSQEQLRQHLGVVPQKALLFDGTVASNLRYGKADATEEEMWHALEVAQGKDFVSNMPAGLEGSISQGGSNVSGGQRQRLAIARAVIRKPDVYIFDDSFSALDFKTDAKLRQALAKETQGAAVLIVAQRVTTVLGADHIIVLDEGKVAGIGTHKELMETCQVYKEIVLSQLSAEEVA
jgi:ATP-binding cassette subfamily B protein